MMYSFNEFWMKGARLSIDFLLRRDTRESGSAESRDATHESRFRDEIHLMQLSNTPSPLSTIQLRRSNDRFWPNSPLRHCAGIAQTIVLETPARSRCRGRV